MRAAEEAVFRRERQLDVMERAGAAVAREAARFATGRPVLVVAGPGNNGGDAYVCARHLRQGGLDVSVAAMGEPKAGAAAEMWSRWEGPVVSLYEARPRPMLVDGLFGTGMTRPLERGPRALLADLVTAADFSLSIDLPSGLETDSGADFGAPRVSATLALAALKPAHVLDAGLERCGHVLLADIAIPVAAHRRAAARPRLAPPGAGDHKYSRGMVVAVECAMPGAARLAARAAMAGGAGYVTLAGADPRGGGPDALVRTRIEAAEDLAELLESDRIASVVIGPGLGRERRSEALLKAALACPHPLVLDGDALTLLGRQAGRWLRDRRAPTWLTPHAGEFARMFEGEGSKIDRTLGLVLETGATVLHKGADTVIAGTDGAVRVLAGASPWLSTAGTGDVLAGLLAAQAARGLRGVAAAEAAVWLHARAASLAGPAFAADALVDHAAAALGECV
ncbi:NAD(P)H-hydrate epimerase [Sphingomonas canadensis]